MPRKPRAAATGALYHVWARGIEKRSLFRDDRDRRDLLARFSELIIACNALCLVWVLMSNHLHLVLQCRGTPLGTLMQRILGGYAVRFNLRHGRAGHLFQNRFGSRLVQSDADLVGVMRYVLRNPLDAGMTRDLRALERYEWSALGALIGRRPRHPFEAIAETLSFFGESELEARERLRALVARPVADGETLASRLDALVREICAELAVSEADLRAGSRAEAVSRARVRVCHTAVTELGIRSADVARALGISRSAVSQALARAGRGARGF